MSKNKIAIVFGGQSSEHDATCKSFYFVYERVLSPGLRKDLEVSHIIYITRDGKAVVTKFNPKLNAQDYETASSPIELTDAIKLIKEENLFVYGILYGQHGEDGVIQGVMDFFSIKSNLGNVFACSIGMSKFHLNQYVRDNFKKIKVPLTACIKNSKNIEKQLEVFSDRDIVVKPSSLGSSVLTEKFLYNSKTKKKVIDLIKQILEFDSKALVQEYVKGTEYSCGCLEKDGKVMQLPSIRIETAGGFFGQKEKFIEGYSKETIVDEKDEDKLLKIAKNTAQEMFEELDFRNVVRFDYIITDKDVYFLETNPLPGILRGSILPRMLRTQGWDVENLIEICFDNENRKRKAQTDFNFEINV